MPLRRTGNSTLLGLLLFCGCTTPKQHGFEFAASPAKLPSSWEGSPARLEADASANASIAQANLAGVQNSAPTGLATLRNAQGEDFAGTSPIRTVSYGRGSSDHLPPSAYAASDDQPKILHLAKHAREMPDAAVAAALEAGANQNLSVVVAAEAMESQDIRTVEAENALTVSLSPESPTLMGSANLVPLNLPSVLAAIDSSHPIVGQARWRVQQAYAEYDGAKALWLPSIQAGFSFHRHDGNYQASNGDIVDVNRNSFQYGLGAGATGAGTTMPRPGLIADFHLADAIFQPKLSQKTAWAFGHGAAATLNQQLLAAGSAYLELLDAHQELQIVEASRQRFAELHTITVNFAEAGEGLQADADRLQTELSLIESRKIAVQERTAITAARLAQEISMDGSGQIVPMDANAVPLELAEPCTDRACFVSQALQNRPELKQSQALVAAACEAYRREKFAPFVPSVLLGFSTGGFGGGLGNQLDNIGDRYDLDALMTWETRNLGFGERAARREQAARVQQARFEKLQVMDQVAREVSEACAQVEFRSQQIAITQQAISAAQDSYRRNLERIRDRQGLPLEVLQSIQALETAERAYLRAVIDYNQAQLQLQWAMGFPVA